MSFGERARPQDTADRRSQRERGRARARAHTHHRVSPLQPVILDDEQSLSRGTSDFPPSLSPLIVRTFAAINRAVFFSPVCHRRISVRSRSRDTSDRRRRCTHDDDGDGVERRQRWETDMRAARATTSTSQRLALSWRADAPRFLPSSFSRNAPATSRRRVPLRWTPSTTSPSSLSMSLLPRLLNRVLREDIHDS